MTPPADNQPSTCGHTVKIGVCTLPDGHEFGHHDETQGPYAQWHDRSDDHGPGAYASIHPGDAVWRHERGECVNVGARRDETWCLWCLRRDRTELINALDDVVMGADLPGDHCELDDAIEQARGVLAALSPATPNDIHDTARIGATS